MNWNVVFSTFPLIFLAALPGRTTFLMLLLATRSRPLPVFIGSVLAFLIQCLISVFLGSLIGGLPHHWVNLGSGILFLFFSFRMWQDRNALGKDNHQTLIHKDFFSSARNAFLSVFAAEWGDVSQLAIASVAAHYSDPIIVWISASLAMTLTSVVAVGLGTQVHKVVNPKVIHYISIFVFAGVGFYFLIEALWKWGH